MAGFNLIPEDEPTAAPTARAGYRLVPDDEQSPAPQPGDLPANWNEADMSGGVVRHGQPVGIRARPLAVAIGTASREAVQGLWDTVQTAAKLGTGEIDPSTPEGSQQAVGVLAGGFMPMGSAATGTGKAIAKAAEAVAPILKAFDEKIGIPAAERLDAFARTGEPAGAGAERVTSAAVKVNDKIYTGANHLEAMEGAAKELGTDVENIHTKVDDEKQTQLDGWVTSSGRFIDSKEAAKVVNSPHEKLDSLDHEFLEQRPEPHSAQEMIQDAHDLGVIGWDAPENISLASLAAREADTPAEAAFRAIPPRSLGAQATPEAMRGAMGHAPGSYDARGKEWIDKIDDTDSARTSIEQIARQYDFFPESRGGTPSPASRAAVAEAAGLDPSEIESGYFAEHFDSDGKVRAVIQALRQTTSDFMDASAKARREPTDENAAAALEAQERQRNVLEYTMGARAESGRSLNAWKDLLRETERSNAVTKLRTAEEPGPAPKDGRAAKAPEVPKGVSDLVQAAGDAQSNPGKPGGLQRLVDAAQKLVDAPAAEGAKPKSQLPPDLAGLVDEASKALRALKGRAEGGQTTLDNLIKSAEKQAADMVKQKTVRKPADALPPELQALVSKSERVVDRFGGIAKGEKAALLLAKAGRTAAEQAEIARQVEGLTPNQVARVLKRLRGDSSPGWLFWSVQQGLISGLITHTKYAFVNTAQTFMDRVIAPEMAAIAGKLRGDDVSLLAPLRAVPELFRAVPDAMAGVKQAFKTGTRVPLESELRLAERGEANPEAAGALVPYANRGPNWGTWKKVFNETQLASAEKVIGVPGRSANSIHTFFKILNERAAGGSRAFEKAEMEGNKPGTDSFWNRYDHHLDNPTDEALKANIEDAYSGTFMEKLGEQTEKFASLVRSTPLKWLIFFTHIPMNMLRRSVEYSPLALLNTLGETRMGSAIKGELGAPAQNLAFSKMAVGTAVGAYFIDKALSGKATGDYPTDPKERRRWAMEGIQPNSIQANGLWLSLERLGPQATVARIAANYAAIIQNYDGQDDKALMTAGLAFALGTAGALADDVGFETIRNIVNVLENPAEAARFAAWQISSYAMPVSLVTQFASAKDPYMRQADTILDGLKYHVPALRETLTAKRDPLYGEPIANPGYHSIMRESPINADPIKAELDRLHYYPTAPEKTIGGVKLTSEQYDRYEATAGPLVKQMLAAAVNGPSYAAQPDAGKQATLKAMVEAGRAKARAAMLADDPKGLMQKGIDAAKARLAPAR